MSIKKPLILADKRFPVRSVVPIGSTLLSVTHMPAYQNNTIGNDGNISSICGCGNVSEYHINFPLSYEAAFSFLLPVSEMDF